nr:MAG TPA: hypothetical protein [Bacteriophage sp.]
MIRQNNLPQMLQKIPSMNYLARNSILDHSMPLMAKHYNKLSSGMEYHAYPEL